MTGTPFWMEVFFSATQPLALFIALMLSWSLDARPFWKTILIGLTINYVHKTSVYFASEKADPSKEQTLFDIYVSSILILTVILIVWSVKFLISRTRRQRLEPAHSE